LRPSFGDIAVLPVLPREAAPAIRVVVRAVRASNGPQLTYPALALNDEYGRPTAAAEAILREGKTLNIAEP
jgi:tRNA1(Val) A37 N6-methylase TrmN6